MATTYNIGEYEFTFSQKKILDYICICGKEECYCLILSVKERKYTTLCPDCIKKYKLFSSDREGRKKGFVLLKIKGLIWRNV